MNFIKKAALSTMICAAVTATVTPSLAAGLSVSYINGKTIEETSNLADGFLFDRVENLFLVSGDDYADALTGGVLAGESNGSILYVSGSKVNAVGMKRINAAKNVYAIGGTNAIAESVTNGLSNFRGRIQGSNRYITSVEVAKTIGNNRNILIASGENFPDALSASALAIHKDMNIILTGKNVVPEGIKEYLNENKDKEVYFVGGSAAVSDKTKREIYTLMNKDQNLLSQRIIAGKNRYETSKAVAQAFGPSSSAIVANALDYKDALLAAPLSAREEAPVMLVSGPTQLGDLSKVLEGRNTTKLYAISTGSNFSINNLGDLSSSLSGEQVEITNTVGKVIAVPKKEEAKAAAPVAPKATTPAPAPVGPKETPAATSFTGWVKESTQVKTGADPSYKTVGTLSKGTKVSGQIIKDYLHIDYNGIKRYIPMSSLSDKEVKSDNSSKINSIVNGAHGFLGYRYVWAAANPNVGFDCSGLTYYLYRTHAGITLNRNSAAQASNGRAVSKSELKPGDLMFFATGGGSRISHVGIYVGNGKLIHASSPSTGVRTDDINSSYYTRTFVTARRILD